jgi:hypothetical protein
MSSLASTDDRDFCHARPRSRRPAYGPAAGTAPALPGRVSPPLVRQRISLYADRVARLTQPLLNQRRAQQAAGQVRRTAAAAITHYRAACLSRTAGPRVDGIRAAVEALEESVFWLQLLRLMNEVATREADAAIAVGLELAQLLGRAETMQAQP